MIEISFLLVFMTVVLIIYFFLISFDFSHSSLKKRKKNNLSESDSLEKESKEYEDSFIFISKEELKATRQNSMFIFAALGMTGFLLSIVGGLILTLLLSFIGYYFPKFILNMKINKRQIAFQSQIVEMLEICSNGLKAGLSFIQALESASLQISSPMKEELKYMLAKNSLGVSLDEALKEMSQRMNNNNFNLFVSAVTTTRQLGGNLPEIFSIISSTIREREAMEGKIDALTSQGRMQAIFIGSMPFILMVGIYFLDKKTIMPLFTNPIGWVLLLIMIVLNTLGFLFIKKIVSIEIN